MQIEIMSRREFESFQYTDHAPVAVVSITGVNDAPVKFARASDMFVCSVMFDDIEREEEGYVMFTEEDAEAIFRFIRFIQNSHKQVQRIVVHCEAGISRSATIAYHIARFIGEGAIAESIEWNMGSGKGSKYCMNSHIAGVINRTIPMP